MRYGTKTMMIFLFSMLIMSCSKMETENTEAIEQEVTFYISNYRQYSFEELTRAVEESALPHIAYAIFDAEGKAVVGTTIQNRGASGYGTLSTTLKQGEYRLVCVGYDKDEKCHIDKPDNVYFDSYMIPQTFLCTKTFTIGSSALTEDITLKRVVSAFRVEATDAIPDGMTEYRFTCDGGGVVLNGLTGFTTHTVGRISSVAIPPSYAGSTNIGCVVYLYLPSKETKVNYIVEARNSSGSVISRKEFHNVPLRQNTVTNYKGNVFTDQEPVEGEGVFNVMVDPDWEEQINL